jgi:hypothetical protein
LKLKLKTKKKEKEKEKVIKFWGVGAGLLLLLLRDLCRQHQYTQQFVVHITIPSQREPIKTEVFFKSFAFLCFSES